MTTKNWHHQIIQSQNGSIKIKDGLEPLLNLFETKEDFIFYFFKSILFFTPDSVKQQALALQNNILKGEKTPVRYSLKTKEYFYSHNKQNKSGITKKSFKNRREAQRFSESNNLFYNFNGNEIKVLIDKDGNYYVKGVIQKATNHTVSQGVLSDISNYIISHIWGRTENPYFFSSLWNITLIPNHLAFILDKPDDNSEIVRILKVMMKLLAIKLYNPNDLHQQDLVDEQTSLLENKYIEMLDKIYNSIIEDNSSYLHPRLENKGNTAKTLTIQKMEDQMINESPKKTDEVKNQVFIFELLKSLSIIEIDFIDPFTSPILCKDLFSMNYPILKEITHEVRNNLDDHMIYSGKPRYYSYNLGKIFTYKEKEYLVTNDLYENNRENLKNWLLGNSIE